MYKPTSKDSFLRKSCRKITASCDHWFVKSLLKPIFFTLPPSLVTLAVSKSNLKEELTSILGTGISSFLTDSSLLVLIGAYLYVIILKSLFSGIDYYSKPERELSRDDILVVLKAIGIVVGDKMKRFSNHAKEACSKTSINPEEIFLELTQPKQKIDLLSN